MAGIGAFVTHDPEDDEPVLPLTRNPKALLDGIVVCNECGTFLRGAIDANGVEWYVHEHDFEDSK